jgi:hypothetical protein
MFRGALSIVFMASALCVTHGAEAPGEFYINRTPATNAQVNARHFINEGEFFASGDVAWDAMNTITFTNRSLMQGSPGFRFETVDSPFGFRTPAQVFYNSPNGEIQGQDSGGSFVFGDPNGNSVSFLGVTTSLLKVNANNITNRGVMTVGANGFIQLHGQSVDLTAGALIVGDLNDPLSGGGGGSGFPVGETNFFPAPGIYDLGWGLGAGTNTSVAGVIGGVNPTSVSTPIPAPTITNIFSGGFGGGFGGNASFNLDEAQMWVREEPIDETNEVVQVIAVQTSDPNIGVFSTFVQQTFPPEPLLGGFLTPVVELRVGSTDFATLARVTNSLYVADQLGSHTNRNLMENLSDGTFRPGNFIVFRGPPDQYGGEPASTNIRADIFTFHLDPDVDYLNNTVSNEWSVYSAQVASAPTRLPQIPGIAITNLGGQVDITASQLKLANTRIRGEGFVSLKAGNVTTGPNVVVDVPRLSIDFGTTSDVLTVSDFTPDRVERFSGYLVAYSTIFTNAYELLATNVDPATSSNVISTNLVEVRFQLTMVDARRLQTTEETVVQDLKFTATNGASTVIYNEDLKLTNYFQIRADNLTFGPESTLYGSRGVAFSYTNLLNVLNFTNFGTIQVNELADLRHSINRPYQNFVNHGNLFAFGTEIWAEYFENTGNISSTNFWTFWGGARDNFGIPFLSQSSEITEGTINIRAGTIRIDSGTFATLGDIRFSGDILKLSNWQGLTGARLVLDIGQTITDTGLAGPNDIMVFSGFEMSSRRPTGDLLGTVITSTANTFEFVDHIWAAEDRGASADGFNNNLALGRLVLEGGDFSVYQFLPSRENSAIYIDVLEINGYQATSLAALTNGLTLGMNVYYADVVSTNPAITAQSINGIFGPNAPFNLIWVPGFAGPNSAVDVPLSQNGPVTRMNRSLRESLTADTDGDGVPNARDPYPMSATGGEPNEVQFVGLERNANGTVTFSVTGPQAGTYVIEFTTNLISPNWQAVPGVLTNDSTSGLKKFSESVNQGSAEGYYRVRLAP